MEERKAWELKTCINDTKNTTSLSEPVKANLQFFIGLRNKIEHRNITKREVDVLIFGECQSLLYNYENFLIHIFGKEYALNESLAFALQFSYMRHEEQKQASKNVLSAELQEIRNYIEKYRDPVLAKKYLILKNIASNSFRFLRSRTPIGTI